MKRYKALKKMKKYLQKGDFLILIERIKQGYGKTFSRNTVAAALSPSNTYVNEIIYIEALKLSLERQEALKEREALESQLIN